MTPTYLFDFSVVSGHKQITNPSKILHSNSRIAKKSYRQKLVATHLFTWRYWAIGHIQNEQSEVLQNSLLMSVSQFKEFHILHRLQHHLWMSKIPRNTFAFYQIDATYIEFVAASFLLIYDQLLSTRDRYAIYCKRFLQIIT